MLFIYMHRGALHIKYVASRISMNWITTNVAIGSYHDALDTDLLLREGFHSILSLTSNLGCKLPTELGVRRIETITLLDGPGNELSRFCLAVTTLESLVTEAAPVLVHCRAGWSRSPAVVACYLMHTQGIGAEAALAEVNSKRVCSMVPELQQLVKEYGDLLQP